MMKEFILTVVSRDRPGIVEAVADVISSHKANWVDSSLARLGGEFAGIVRIEIPEDATSQVLAGLKELVNEEIEVTVRSARPEPPSDGVEIQLEFAGADHPGIVHDISAALARHGATIIDFESRVSPGTMTGERIFSAEAVIIVPRDVMITALRDELEDVAGDLMVDIDLRSSSD